MREFLLSIASPEAISWSGFLVLAIALVGEAGVFLIPVKWERIHKEIGFALAVLAAAGYAVERIGDDAIVNELRNRAEAAEKVANENGPRDLSLAQQDNIAKAMRFFWLQRYQASLLPGAPDAISFWATLFAALKKADWQYTFPGSSNFKTGEPPASILIVADPGVTISFAPAEKAAAQALAGALEDNGIKAVAAPDENAAQEQVPMNIRIGVKAPIQ